jgi:hypothetical protein
MSYITYNSISDVRSLDLNTADGNIATEFPYHIYDGETFPISQYLCESGPRDTRYNYIYNTERMEHPDFFSRFAYGYCDNGYCSGHWNGRYNTPGVCFSETDKQPKNMAPSRFYEPHFQSALSCDHPAYDLAEIYRTFH